MSAPNFRSLTMAATCAAAALGVTSLSLRVARSGRRWRTSKRKSCSLSATFGSSRPRSGRAAVCPSSSAGMPARSPFGAGCRSVPARRVRLARLTEPEHKVDFQAPVVLASAPRPEPHKAPIGEESTDDSGASDRRVTHTASPGKFENRDARGPGKAGRRILWGRNEVHGQAGHSGETGPIQVRG